MAFFSHGCKNWKFGGSFVWVNDILKENFVIGRKLGFVTHCGKLDWLLGEREREKNKT